MFTNKIFLFALVALLILCDATYAQMPHHPMPPSMPAPSAPQVVVPVPVIIPTAPQMIALPPKPAEKTVEQTPPPLVDEKAAAEKAKRISDLEKMINDMKSELYKMERAYLSNKIAPQNVPGSLEQAEFNAAECKRTIEWNLNQIAIVESKHASDPTYYGSDTYVKYLIGIYRTAVQTNQAKLDYWQAEMSVRKPAVDEAKIAYMAKNKEYELLQAELTSLKESVKKDAAVVPTAATQKKEAADKKEKTIVSTTDLDSDVFSSKNEGDVAAETVDIKRNMTMQELREEDLSRAFSELGITNKTLAVLETANIAGQATQTIIGFVPGLDGADLSLSIGRGFAEALGDELAKGTSISDALKIAALNGGIKGTISYIGNELTSGTGAMTNRVAVLSQVGFDKLTSKQITEMGAKGISYLVIKTSQTLTQEVVGAAIDPAVNKAEDAIRNQKGKTETTSGYGSGFGTSVATQPLVSY